MTDYFCFSDKVDWTSCEGLKFEGFIQCVTNHRMVKLVKKTEDGDQVALYRTMFGEPEPSGPWIDVHTLVTNRYRETLYTVFDDFFWNGHKIKRFCVLGAFDNERNRQKHAEVEFMKNLFGLCIDELCLGFYICGDIFENIITGLETCKAKSLYIKITITRDSSKQNQKAIDRLLNLKNLSRLEIYSVFLRHALDEINVEKILLNRRSKLETVCILCLNDTYQVCSGKILSQRLHPVLLDVAISLSNLGLPVYPLYFILEFLPQMRGHNRYLVIKSLEKIEKSIRKIKQNKFEQ